MEDVTGDDVMTREEWLQDLHNRRRTRTGLPSEAFPDEGGASPATSDGGGVGNAMALIGDPVGHDESVAISGYLAPSANEILQLFSFVQFSPFVTTNPMYMDLAAKVDFSYESANDQINAYSMFDGKTLYIRMLAGAARFARLVSIAAARDLVGGDRGSSAFLKTLFRHFDGNMTERGALRMAGKCGLGRMFLNDAIRVKASAISAGMLLTVLAHEMGHVVLGHVMRGDEVSNEISQNMEREADSFASSVISASPFGEYMFTGMLFWHYALMRLEELVGQSASGMGDHPGSRERYENLVQANPSKAAVFGLSV